MTLTEQEIADNYGRDAAEWLRRWDAGETVWTISMGGLGPGYEQCIQVTVAEMVRCMLDLKMDHSKWTDSEAWKVDQKRSDEGIARNPEVTKLGLSGAQFGAAMSLATALYMRGPATIMREPEVKDRHIMVSKNFPS